MFNLLMYNVDWVSGKAMVPMGRMFEYTDDNVANQFRQDGSPLLDRMTALPCVFTTLAFACTRMTKAKKAGKSWWE